MKVEKLLAVKVEEGGIQYVRFSPVSWAQWMGESLEMIQFEEGLEGRYQAHLASERLTRKRQCVKGGA